MDRTYYAQKLNASRLEKVYAVAGPRIRQYLQAEVDHVAGFIAPSHRILELGCGYGRVLGRLAPMADHGWGVDNAFENLRLFRKRHPEPDLAAMDAAALAFAPHGFDLVFGVQNFISACHVPPKQLLRECLRVTCSGGRILLSSYADRFWFHRLDWFRRQARESLLGPIDESATGNGVIVCKDGFRATTFRAPAFRELADSCNVNARVYEVDDSSLFCEIKV
jgi:2-polyprenyl-6-hydroxyphenyl methylase/3-demethylubiquinone-9 3-methyltransferase